MMTKSTTSTTINLTGSGYHASSSVDRTASYLYALITSQRSVSRRNRASWYLRQLNKVIKCDPIEVIEQDGKLAQDYGSCDVSQELSQTDSKSPLSFSSEEKDIFLVSMVSSHESDNDLESLTTINSSKGNKDTTYDQVHENQRYLVTPNTKVLYLFKSIATSIILDLSPSIVSVNPQNESVFLDSMFDALKRVLHLLIKEHEFPSSQPDRQFTLIPKVFVSVIAYTPFIVAKNNQVLVQNRQIAAANIEQVIVELWICLNRLVQELHELMTSTHGMSFEYDVNKTAANSAFTFTQSLHSGIIRHPGSVLDDIFELGLFSASLMPRLSRLSIVIITDGLFASSNNLSAFRLKNIAVSFVSLANDSIFPDSCFGYTTYSDLMKFVARSTQGIYISHNELIELSYNLSKAKQVQLMNNPLYRLLSWTLHCDSEVHDHHCVVRTENGSRIGQPSNPTLVEMKPENIARLFCIDQPIETIVTSSSSTTDNHAGDVELASNQNYHDWRSFKQMSKNLDADFEQVLACFLREGYLIKNIQLQHPETSNIVARLVLFWKHNLNIEQELQAPYWNSADPYEISDSNNLILKPFLAPSYGDTYCELIVHGSYNFLHDFYCDKKLKRRSDYRSIAYQQFENLILGVKQTYDKLQYLSRYYRDSNLSKVPTFLQHGNSLLFEQPHTQNLASTIDNVVDKNHQALEFSEYWQDIAQLDLRNWRNLMHIHTLRLILEHDQPKYKNIHYQNANGRYTHIQCRRAMSVISNFIKSYATFALLEDSLYIKFIHSKEDDLREIETSATKGFVVIRIKKLSPIVVIYLMFTSGIQDSHRVQIVRHIENELIKCRLRNVCTATLQSTGNIGTSGANTNLNDTILKSKVIHSSGDACCIVVRSPLERMLRVYGRNVIGEFMVQNLTYGLPGSCPQSILSRVSQNKQQQGQLRQNDHGGQQAKTRSAAMNDQHNECSLDSHLADNRYNPIFGKYLYGVRVVHTISNLPHDLVHQIVQNVLVKISAILVNVRIEQGFHIAFNNSGLLTLVNELAMKDYSHDSHSSNCLCQYLVFPPSITNCCSHARGVLNQTTQNSASTNEEIGSQSKICLANSDNLLKPESLVGSLANSDHSASMTQHDISSPNMQCESQGEVKVIREYWIEQQYGISIGSTNYHKSLNGLRYSEVVDHLYLTDITIFDCLLTYDLLQLLCDKLSPFHNLDIALSQTGARPSSLFSPTNSTNSSSIFEQCSPVVASLPSNLIDGTAKDPSSRVPLIELDYQFSLINFLDYCQFASIDVHLFKDESEFYKLSLLTDPEVLDESKGRIQTITDTAQFKQMKVSRRMSVDTNNHDSISSRRLHRSSYDSLNASTLYHNVDPILSHSLNYLFLETLHKRFKQIHDKELRLSDSDKKQLTNYFHKRKIALESGQNDMSTDVNFEEVQNHSSFLGMRSDGTDAEDKNLGKNSAGFSSPDANNDKDILNWRCFMRKGNQENLMVVLIPSTFADILKWMNYVESSSGRSLQARQSVEETHRICPIFVFRCSSSMISNQILSFMGENKSVLKPSDTELSPKKGKSNLECDLSLHFGQPCFYMNKFRSINDELFDEILPVSKFNELSNGISDEKTLESVHFRAFLRKIKNTVLKSRFDSLNDAYLSELFVHKNDILYYISGVEVDIQKKYHVSSNLKGLAEFIRSYEDYHDSLPKEQVKQCNHLLNSILLQKCGLFINQPLVRFDEANPLMRQLHDRKLVFLMENNYRIELPILEENLAKSTFLKSFIKKDSTKNMSERSLLIHNHHHHHNQYHHHRQHNILSNPQMQGNRQGTMGNGYSINETTLPMASSLGRASGIAQTSIADVKYGSIGSPGMILPGSSPSESLTGSSGVGTSSTRIVNDHRLRQAPAFNSNSNLSLTPSNDSFFLEAFRNSSCSIQEISNYQSLNDISQLHEAHMAEALRRKGMRRESHHYRRVLKSKANYNQSHGAIDQALKRVDGLGRLEHFCLTPLLFSPAWRSKLAPVRDHTIESPTTYHRNRDHYDLDKSGHAGVLQQDLEERLPQNTSVLSHHFSSSSENNNILVEQNESSERWHQTICNNYIKEYEQYIQTLGFNSVQIRFPSSSKLQTSVSSSSSVASMSQHQSNRVSRKTSLQGSVGQSVINHGAKYSSANRLLNHQRRDSSSTSTSFVPVTNHSTPSTAIAANANNASNVISGGTANTGYLIKFLNSGCLVFKVGFCKPYVYSILYSIEGERFNSSNTKMNMTAFLDELDSIKVTLHLHSFTYDYHLRSMYSYISRRQMNFNPGYHLISFADDFRKYYQKAPNYARNHILSGEVNVSNLIVDGQQLYNYIVTHNLTYQLEVLEMANSNINNLLNNISSYSTMSQSNNEGSEKAYPTATQQFASFLSSQFSVDHKLDEPQPASGRNHANDYVLIELKREKVRYKDGRDPDIFDCGLLIAHDHQKTVASKSCLVLKYFLILTNQRDLYPKLVHAGGDSMISFGCHRPIRLGIVNQLTLATTPTANILRKPTTSTKTSTADEIVDLNNEEQYQNKKQQQQDLPVRVTSSNINTIARPNLHVDPDDIRSTSEFLSSSELSGPQSIISTANSIRSSSSTGVSLNPQQKQIPDSVVISDTEYSLTSSIQLVAPNSRECGSPPASRSKDAVEALEAKEEPSSSKPPRISGQDSLEFQFRQNSSSVSVTTTNGGECQEDDGTSSNLIADAIERNSSPSSLSFDPIENKLKEKSEQCLQQLERTICDEEITYLGYFSSDEMDMLRFLQEKTANLTSHLEHIVRSAEVHFRRDFLWQKLMQRPAPADQQQYQLSTSIVGGSRSSPGSLSSDQLPLSTDELAQLLSYIEAVDLASLDPNLAPFVAFHMTWYTKLIRTFNELKYSPAGGLHRIYTLASKTLLLYIDPRCTTAFVLLSVNTDRGLVELNLMFKDKQDCSSSSSSSSSKGHKMSSQTTSKATTNNKDDIDSNAGTQLLDLDVDCQQLIGDFINFCATFMWSNLLTG